MSLTFKRELFCREFIRCKGNGTQAIRRAYPGIRTENARWQMAHRLVSNSKVKERIREILEDSEFSIKNLSKYLKQCLEAKKPLLLNGKLQLVDDNITQIEAVKLGFKLYGVFRTK